MQSNATFSKIICAAFSAKIEFNVSLNKHFQKSNSPKVHKTTNMNGVPMVVQIQSTRLLVNNSDNWISFVIYGSL